MDKPILDACCGGRMMYFDKHDTRVLGQDIRIVPRHKIESNGSYFEVSPDVVGDFRKMDFPDNSFSMVIFDPPHLKSADAVFMLSGWEFSEGSRRELQEALAAGLPVFLQKITGTLPRPEDCSPLAEIRNMKDKTNGVRLEQCAYEAARLAAERAVPTVRKSAEG